MKLIKIILFSFFPKITPPIFFQYTVFYKKIQDKKLPQITVTVLKVGFDKRIIIVALLQIQRLLQELLY